MTPVQQIKKKKKAKTLAQIANEKTPKKNVVLPAVEAPVERPVPAVVRDMSPALRGVYDHLLEKINSTERRNATTLYSIGVQVQHVMSDTKKYGKAAVESLAQALGQKLTPATLRTYARVTTMFSQEEITALLDKPTSNNRRLSFSHLIALSSVADKTLRTKLLRKTFAESWSFAELQVAVREALGRGGSDRPIIAPATPKAGLSQLSSAVSALVARNEAWEEAIFTPLSDLPALSPELRKLVEATEQQLETALQRMDATRARLHELLDSPTAEAGEEDEDADELPEGDEDEEGEAAEAEDDEEDDEGDDEDEEPPTPRKRRGPKRKVRS